MSKPRVFVSRLIPEAGLEKLRQACDAEIWQEELPPPRSVILEKVRGLDGILSLLTDRMDAEVMDTAGSQLKVISNYAVGFDNIDIPAATGRGIPVGYTPGAPSPPLDEGLSWAPYSGTMRGSGRRRVVDLLAQLGQDPAEQP